MARIPSGGIPAATGNYQHGRRVGLWSFHDASGTRIRQGPFVDGKAEGTFQEWFANGQPWHEVVFHADERQGPAETRCRQRLGTWQQDYDERVEGCQVDGLREGALGPAGTPVGSSPGAESTSTGCCTGPSASSTPRASCCTAACIARTCPSAPMSFVAPTARSSAARRSSPATATGSPTTPMGRCASAAATGRGAGMASGCITTTGARARSA
ncbi:MAG: hypothetical protein IPG96_20540 [Proteobacteria bacterium]|nr:hypothetical protein [Pseudomonadota bacterium]